MRNPALQTAFVGMGSNLGDREEMFRRALAMMHDLPRTHVTGLSPLYYTKPEDGAGPGEFLNGVTRLETALSPSVLLTALEQIERTLGRMAKGDYQPRTIDLDLLLYGDRVLDSPPLVVPHPRMTRRAFVLQPLSDLAPATAIPPGILTAAEHLAQLGDSGTLRPATDVNLHQTLLEGIRQP